MQEHVSPYGSKGNKTARQIHRHTVRFVVIISVKLHCYFPYLWENHDSVFPNRTISDLLCVWHLFRTCRLAWKYTHERINAFLWGNSVTMWVCSTNTLWVEVSRSSPEYLVSLQEAYLRDDYDDFQHVNSGLISSMTAHAHCDGCCRMKTQRIVHVTLLMLLTKSIDEKFKSLIL